MDIITCNSMPTPSLRVRTNSRLTATDEKIILNEIQLCPSVMSERTKKMLPPNSERIQTKPFPIRGEYSRKASVLTFYNI